MPPHSPSQSQTCELFLMGCLDVSCLTAVPERLFLRQVGWSMVFTATDELQVRCFVSMYTIDHLLYKDPPTLQTSTIYEGGL